MIIFFRAAFLRHAPHRFAVMQPAHADRKYNDYTGQLSDAQIAAHLAGRATYAVPTAEHGLASYLPLDVDAGGMEAIYALMQAAAERGLWSFGQHHPERERGYVWIPFDDLTNAERIRQLGDELIHQVQRPGWKVENRATNEDTRLPLARHQWTGTHGHLVLDSARIDIDADPQAAGQRLAATYRENPTSKLPAPAPAPTRPTHATNSQGITIAAYNATTDLVHLLESYGAKRSRGQGARLYFCPFHDDNHASLLISKDGQHCRCMSTGSDCALTNHQHDAFNVLCIGERFTPQQALRRLNGHPDDPQSSPQTPPAAPGTLVAHNEERRPLQGHNTAQQPTAPATMYPQQRNTSELRLPKTCRRVLDVFSQASGQYWRGVAHLAEVLDVDPRTIQRSLRRLEAEHLIERQERGRDGHTDIYRLAQGGAAKRVNHPDEAAPAPGGGRHLPPTVLHENHDHAESGEARRGGNGEPAHNAEIAPAPAADADADADGAQCGPGGALAFVGGAAYVPPQAEQWYSLLVQCAQPAPEEHAPEQIALPAHEAERPAEPEPPRSTKRRRRRDACTNPAQLAGRITAATRKAEKIARTNPRQAAAIRRQVEQLQCRLAMLRAELEAEADATAEAQTLDAPTPSGPTSSRAQACPPSSLPSVDYAATARNLVARLRSLQAGKSTEPPRDSAPLGHYEAHPQAIPIADPYQESEQLWDGSRDG